MCVTQMGFKKCVPFKCASDKWVLKRVSDKFVSDKCVLKNVCQTSGFLKNVCQTNVYQTNMHCP